MIEQYPADIPIGGKYLRMNRRVVGYREGDFPVGQRVADPCRCICPETVADQNDRLVRGQAAQCRNLTAMVRRLDHPSPLSGNFTAYKKEIDLGEIVLSGSIP